MFNFFSSRHCHQSPGAHFMHGMKNGEPLGYFFNFHNMDWIYPSVSSRGQSHHSVFFSTRSCCIQELRSKADFPQRHNKPVICILILQLNVLNLNLTFFPTCPLLFKLQPHRNSGSSILKDSFNPSFTWEDESLCKMEIQFVTHQPNKVTIIVILAREELDSERKWFRGESRQEQNLSRWGCYWQLCNAMHYCITISYSGICICINVSTQRSQPEFKWSKLCLHVFACQYFIILLGTKAYTLQGFWGGEKNMSLSRKKKKKSVKDEFLQQDYRPKRMTRSTETLFKNRFCRQFLGFKTGF